MQVVRMMMGNDKRLNASNLTTDPGANASDITGTTVGTKRGMNVYDISQGETSTLNSSTTPLTSGATFTGTGEQNDFSHVGVMVKTDQSGTLYFDFSIDGTNWDSTFPVSGFAVSANISEFHTAVKLGRYFRVRFVNDTVGAQTYFRLQTYYGNSFVPSNAPLNQSLGLDSDALSVRPSSFTDEVIIGRRSGITNFTKFGYRDTLAAANGEETIWATTGNFTPMTTASTFTIAYNNTTDGLGTTGALTLYFVYVDADGKRAIGTHTLSNTGSDVTTFTGFGINRVAISSAGSVQLNTNNITVTATTGGTTQAIIPALQGVTQQCIYHTASDSDAVAKYLWINANKTSGGGAPRIVIKGYVFNRQFQIKFEVFRCTVDTNSTSVITLSEPNGFSLSPTDVLYFVADTDTNSSAVNLRFSLMEYKRI